MVKRTKKEFKDYNSYRDQPFGLKWRTAYAMEELQQSIRQNNAHEHYSPKVYFQMSPDEINQKLAKAYQKEKPVAVQLNRRDSWGRLKPSIEGFVLGQLDQERCLIDQYPVDYDDIRHVQVLDIEKWFQV